MKSDKEESNYTKPNRFSKSFRLLIIFLIIDSIRFAYSVYSYSHLPDGLLVEYTIDLDGVILYKWVLAFTLLLCSNRLIPFIILFFGGITFLYIWLQPLDISYSSLTLLAFIGFIFFLSRYFITNLLTPHKKHLI